MLGLRALAAVIASGCIIGSSAIPSPAPVPGGAGLQDPSKPLPDGVSLVSDAERLEFQQLTQIAQLSYCNNTELAVYKCYLCSGVAATFTDLKTINSKDGFTHGFLAAQPAQKKLYLSFQGSVFQENWNANFDLLRTSLNTTGMNPNAPFAPLAKKAVVHRGLQNAFEGVRMEIRKTLEQYMQKYVDYTVHAVGHSYGCSISMFAVVDLALSNQWDPKRIFFTGMGCPRIGNFEWARLMDGPQQNPPQGQLAGLGLGSVNRLVHSNDLVSRASPIPLGFRHPGEEIWIDVKNKRTLRCNDVKKGLDESPSCSNSVFETSLSINSHVSYYMNEISENVCYANPAGGLVDTRVPVKYLAYEINPKSS
ncbi:hypothetical protein HDU97_003932 [Phlyctochytrium planicorne]|nr:hypothetical protein HDU97_003932 [Phlyctochytrium planicorne]